MGKLRPDLLDLGCGFGRFHAKFKDYEITGIDLNKDYLLKACQDFPYNKYIMGNICDKDELHSILGDKKFDLVISYDTLEHVLQPRSLIENIYNYVKEGGICEIITPNALGYELTYRLHPNRRRINNSVTYFNRTMQFLTPCVIKSIINRIGGKIIYQNIGSRFWLKPITITFKKDGVLDENL